MPPRYRLGLSAFVVDRAAAGAGGGSAQGHDWETLGRQGVRHYELSMLTAPDGLRRALAALGPASFGIHWPLFAEDGLGLRLLDSTPAEFERNLDLLRRRTAGTGAAYLLVHFGQRGERWPPDAEVARRLAALADLAGGLGTEIVLEPKQSIAMPDGLIDFSERVRQLPRGLALCLDVNDWTTAVGRHGHPRARLAGSAAFFHLHAMHRRPDGSGLYLHAPPWTDPGPDPAWPEVGQPEPADLRMLAAADRPVTVQVELHPRYLGRLGAAVRAVRARLAGLGWIEEGAPGGAG